MNALATIQKLPETRSEQRSFVNAAIEEIINGDNDPARIYAKLRIIGDTIKDILDSEVVKSAAIREVEKYPDFCNVNGNRVMIQSKTTYKYDNCGDSVYTTLKLRIKERETFLKSLRPGMIAVDEHTGETLKMPEKSVSTYIVIK